MIAHISKILDEPIEDRLKRATEALESDVNAAWLASLKEWADSDPLWLNYFEWKRRRGES